MNQQEKTDPAFDNIKLTSEINKILKSLEDHLIITSIPKNSVSLPSAKMGILLTTSVLKIKLLGLDLIELVNNHKFLVAMATLRMIFEELVLLIFVLSKLEKLPDWPSTEYVLTRVLVGRHSRDETDIPPEKKPYNIVTALEEAEKYADKLPGDTKGKFDETYTFISDFVHPNAPTRYYFWQIVGESVTFVYRKEVGRDDLGSILNYTSITLKLYLHIWTKLNELKFKDLGYSGLTSWSEDLRLKNGSR